MIEIEGDFELLLGGLSGRLKQFVLYGEFGLGGNAGYFGAQLETASLRLFRHQIGEHLYEELEVFFGPKNLEEIPPSIVHSSLPGTTAATRDRLLAYNRTILQTRLTVLESLLTIVPAGIGREKLIADIKRIFINSGVSLDIEGDPPLIVPLDQPLLQRGVLNNLMPKLSKGYPDRAQELIEAYQKLLKGEKLDEIFVGAFKTLEALARSLTGDAAFEFTAANLKKYFPNLHPTIHVTIAKLAAQRGDEGAHGQDAPEPHEIRYLLFAVCNIALLLLDHPELAEGSN